MSILLGKRYLHQTRHCGDNITRKMNLNIEYSLDEENGKVGVSYKGKCTPNEFDRAILQIITVLTTMRSEEMERRGLSQNLIKYREDKENKKREFDKP